MRRFLGIAALIGTAAAALVGAAVGVRLVDYLLRAVLELSSRIVCGRPGCLGSIPDRWAYVLVLSGMGLAAGLFAAWGSDIVTPVRTRSRVGPVILTGLATAVVVAVVGVRVFPSSTGAFWYTALGAVVISLVATLSAVSVRTARGGRLMSSRARLILIGLLVAALLASLLVPGAAAVG